MSDSHGGEMQAETDHKRGDTSAALYYHSRQLDWNVNADEWRAGYEAYLAKHPEWVAELAKPQAIKVA